MTQENENKQRRVDDKRADVPLQWSEATPAPAATDTAAEAKPTQREIPEFTGLDTIARVFAEVANGDGKVVLSAQSCDLLYRAMTTPIVAPAVQAQAELTDANELREIAVILEREGYRMNAMKLRQIALRSAAGSTVRESLDVASLRDSYEQSQGAAGSAYPAVAGPVGQVVDIDRNCNESIINIALEPGTAIYLAAQSRDDVRSAAREQARNEAHWISVDERLPPPCQTVIVHSVRPRSPKVDATYISTRPREVVDDEQITHWMPLPEAPAASKEGDAA